MPVARNAVAPDLASGAEIGGSPLNYPVGIDTVHRLVRQHAGAAGGRTEEGDFPAVTDAGRLYISVEIGFEIVVSGISWRLPPFSCRRTHQRLPCG